MSGETSKPPHSRVFSQGRFPFLDDKGRILLVLLPEEVATMKIFRLNSAVVLLSVFCLTSVWSQIPEGPDPVLGEGDVKQFVETYPQLKMDLDEYGVQMDLEAGELSYDEALKANQEFLAILKKHGWDENFWVKAQTILLGIMVLTSEEAGQQSNPEFEKAKEQIESNPALSAEMKKQLLERLAGTQAAMGTQMQMMKTRINPLDLAQVKPHLEELKGILE
jgi:hypothetical protein